MDDRVDICGVSFPTDQFDVRCELPVDHRERPGISDRDHSASGEVEAPGEVTYWRVTWSSEVTGN